VTRVLVVKGLSYYGLRFFYGLRVGSPVGVGGGMREVGSTD